MVKTRLVMDCEWDGANYVGILTVDARAALDALKLDASLTDYTQSRYR